MKCFKRLIMTLLVMTIMTYTIALSAQPVDYLKKGVVKVRDTKRDITGTGFIVKLTEDSAYIVTSTHVVWDGFTVSPVEIEFSSKRGKLVDATLYRFEENKDGLAVFVVDKNDVPKDINPLILSTMMDQLKEGEELTLIGFPRGAPPWAIVEGKYVGREGKFLTFTGPVESGNSGGPLLKHGLIYGMITETAETFSHALSAVIVRDILEGWEIDVEDVVALNNLAEQAYREDRVTEALRLWKNILSKIPGNAQANNGLALIAQRYIDKANKYLQIQECRNAEKNLRLATEAKPDYPEIVALLNRFELTCKQTRNYSVELGVHYIMVEDKEPNDLQESSDGNFLPSLLFSMDTRKWYLEAGIIRGTISFAEFGGENNDDEWYDRTQIDLLAGYYVRSNIAIFLGYEYLSLDGSLKSDSNSGPLMGVLGYHTISKTGLKFHWKLSTMGPFDTSEDGTIGLHASASVKGLLRAMPIGYSVGAFYQKYDSTRGDVDVLVGLAFGLYYSY